MCLYKFHVLQVLVHPNLRSFVATLHAIRHTGHTIKSPKLQNGIFSRLPIVVSSHVYTVALSLINLLHLFFLMVLGPPIAVIIVLHPNALKMFSSPFQTVHPFSALLFVPHQCHQCHLSCPLSARPPISELLCSSWAVERVAGKRQQLRSASMGFDVTGLA